MKPPKGFAAIIMGKMHPKHEMEAEEDDGNEQGLSAASDDLIDAVHSKDTEGVATALQNAFAILDSMPHEEGEHEESEER